MMDGLCIGGNLRLSMKKKSYFKQVSEVLYMQAFFQNGISGAKKRTQGLWMLLMVISKNVFSLFEFYNVLISAPNFFQKGKRHFQLVFSACFTLSGILI